MESLMIRSRMAFTGRLNSLTTRLAVSAATRNVAISSEKNMASETAQGHEIGPLKAHVWRKITQESQAQNGQQYQAAQQFARTPFAHGCAVLSTRLLLMHS